LFSAADPLSPFFTKAVPFALGAGEVTGFFVSAFFFWSILSVLSSY
jgi:hypothetical protein